MSEHTSKSVSHHEDDAWVTGLSPAIHTLEGVVTEIARTNLPILLVGESGTGKEMFAIRLHRLSQNCDGAFTRIACASMSPSSLAAELGTSSSGGNSDCRSCDGATVLFDEISDLDPACQRYLLTILPDGVPRARKGVLRARLITTTSRNLEPEVRAGRFRSELYYRLNGICLRLPALRDRKEDIPALAESFVAKHAAQYGRTKSSLSPETMRVLSEHSWPGNIRELENVIKKIVALGDEHLALADMGSALPETIHKPPAANGTYSLKAAARAASREAERELILKALARTRWNRKRAAQELQISYKSLLYKLKQIGFEETTAN
ncbi:MAG TPA: sigma 54-interacting transcriptional regulator [Candidatus Acidoferrales bacterium]|nr:sigma 54-interacting transcriptional regulator [Candidatus Acidoferrales bacterium]